MMNITFTDEEYNLYASAKKNVNQASPIKQRCATEYSVGGGEGTETNSHTEKKYSTSNVKSIRATLNPQSLQ